MNKDKFNFVWFILAGAAVVAIAALHPLTMIQTVSFVLLAGFFFYLGYKSFKYDRSDSEYGEPTGLKIHPYISKLIRSAAVSIPALFLFYLLTYMGLLHSFKAQDINKTTALAFTNLELNIFGQNAHSRFSKKFANKLLNDAIAYENSNQLNDAIETMEALQAYRLNTYQPYTTNILASIGGLYDKLGNHLKADEYYACVEHRKNGFINYNVPFDKNVYLYKISANRLYRMLKATPQDRLNFYLIDGEKQLTRLKKRSAIERGSEYLAVTPFTRSKVLRSVSDEVPFDLKKTKEAYLDIDLNRFNAFYEDLKSKKLLQKFPDLQFYSYKEIKSYGKEELKSFDGAKLMPRTLADLALEDRTVLVRESLFHNMIASLYPELNDIDRVHFVESVYIYKFQPDGVIDNSLAR